MTSYDTSNGAQSLLHQQLRAAQQQQQQQLSPVVPNQQLYVPQQQQQQQQQPQHQHHLGQHITAGGSSGTGGAGFNPDGNDYVGSLGSSYYGSYSSLSGQGFGNGQLNSPLNTGAGNTPTRGNSNNAIPASSTGNNNGQAYFPALNLNMGINGISYDNNIPQSGNPNNHQDAPLLQQSSIAGKLSAGKRGRKDANPLINTAAIANASPLPSPMNFYPTHHQQQRNNSIAGDSLLGEDDDLAGGGKIMDTSEKRARRRASHNAVERRRRDIINEKIHELSQLLPDHHLLPADAQNKGSILRRSVDHMRGVQALAGRQAERISELENVCRILMGRAGVMEHELVMSLPLGTTFELPVPGMPGGGITGPQLAGARMAAEAAAAAAAAAGGGNNGSNPNQNNLNAGIAGGLVAGMDHQRRDSIHQGAGLGMILTHGGQAGFVDNGAGLGGNPHQMNFGME